MRDEFKEAQKQFGAMLYFVDNGHKQRFIRALRDARKVDSDGSIDRQYGAAFYILTAHKGEWESVFAHVPPHGPYGWIDFKKILKIPFGGGMTRMVRLANSLYNGNTKIDALDTISNLDLPNFKVCIDAIALCYYGLTLPEQEESLTHVDNEV